MAGRSSSLAKTHVAGCHSLNNTAFKSALFTPIKPIDLKTLTRAVECYESLTGDTVDVDKNAIADAVKRFVAEQAQVRIPIEAQAKMHRLPVVEAIEGYRESLAAIEDGTPDDCVNTLVGSGTSLKESHERVRKIGECLDEAGRSRLYGTPVWPWSKSGRSLRPVVMRIWRTLPKRSGDCWGPRPSATLSPRSRQRQAGSTKPTPGFTEKPMGSPRAVRAGC